MKNSGKPANAAGSLRQLYGGDRRRVVEHREVAGRVPARHIVFDHRQVIASYGTSPMSDGIQSEDVGAESPTVSRDLRDS